MTQSDKPSRNILSVIILALLFALTYMFLFRDETLPGKGQTLEILGAILVFSSFVGDRRLQLWENAIREFLIPRPKLILMREFSRTLAEKLNPVFENIPKWISFPVAILYTIFVYWQFGDTLFSPTIPISLRILMVCQDGPVLIFLLIILFLRLKPVGYYVEMIAKGLAEFVAWVVTSLLFVISMLSGLSLYSITFVLLMPYYLTDLISHKLTMRPTIGVLGTLLTLLGTVLQKF